MHHSWANCRIEGSFMVVIIVYITLLKEFVKFHLTTAKDSNENEKENKHVVDGHNSKDI